jgi:hypothetical protein
MPTRSIQPGAALVREQDSAKLGMDAVRTDQNIAFRCEPFTRRRDKVRFDLAVCFVPGHKGAINMNGAGGTCIEGVVVQALQPAAMD